METGQTVLQAEDKMDDGTAIKLKIEISDEVSIEQMIYIRMHAKVIHTCACTHTGECII